MSGPFDKLKGHSRDAIEAAAKPKPEPKPEAKPEPEKQSK